MSEAETSNTKRKPRKIQADWSDDKVTILIQAVENQPILWNTSLPEYRSTDKRNAAWNNISEVVFKASINADECKNKWQGLRSQYKESLNKKLKKISCQDWKYFNQMNFLKSGDGSEQRTETASNLVNYFFCIIYLSQNYSSYPRIMHFFYWRFLQARLKYL